MNDLNWIKVKGIRRIQLKFNKDKLNLRLNFSSLTYGHLLMLRPDQRIRDVSFPKQIRTAPNNSRRLDGITIFQSHFVSHQYSIRYLLQNINSVRPKYIYAAYRIRHRIDRWARRYWLRTTLIAWYTLHTLLFGSLPVCVCFFILPKSMAAQRHGAWHSRTRSLFLQWLCPLNRSLVLLPISLTS